MALTAGELKKALNDITDDTLMYLLVEGKVVSIAGVTRADEVTMAIIHGTAPTIASKRFSRTEDGVIGGLYSRGLSDAKIAQLLGRPENSVTQRRKRLGFTSRQAKCTPGLFRDL